MRSLIPKATDLVPAPDAWGGARAVAAAAGDLVLALDAEGVVRDLLLPDRTLATDLAGYTGWIGGRWDARVTTDSRPEVEALLSRAMADPGVPLPAAPWRLVEHVTSRGAVIPLLCTALPPAAPDAPVVVLGRDLMRADLAGLALRHEAPVVRAYARAMLTRGGVSPVDLCLDLLAPAARRVGDLWTEDRCDTLAVVEATFRLRAALAEIPDGPTPAGRRRRALLCLAPGEEHGLGIALVQTLLGLAGWEARIAPHPAEAPHLLRAEPFDLLGLSAALEAHLPDLRAVIRECRRAAGRRHPLKVMLGGWVFVRRPGLAAELDADGVALDARQAVLVADGLVPEHPAAAG